MKLLEPIGLGGRVAPSRVLFGPHVTNLARGRAVSERHVAYYERRARSGCGVIVVEEASVHPSDWPYERSPLASASAEGWAAVAGACHPHGSLVLAGLGHAGGQGSSAYSQGPLWAPSRVPEVNTREVPKQMEASDIAAVVDGFRDAARLAVLAGLDGVEVNAGQHSLVRQFLSGLTNQRGDEWGSDRSRFAREVLQAAREGLGASGAVLGLRLSCDELAPWAGITPDAATVLAAELAALVDYLVVVRGSIFSAEATRPDMHLPTSFNRELCRAVRTAVRSTAGEATPDAGTALAGSVPPVVLQGSVVDPAEAEAALAEGVCDLVEMTRAQLADSSLVAKLRAGRDAEVRPCLLCNQTCQVRDARNPIVTCVLDPSTGHETDDAELVEETLAMPATSPRPVLVVGAGPAGLELARVARLRGHEVQVVERSERTGGSIRIASAAAGRARLALSVDWLAAECERLGVRFTTGREATPAACADAAEGGTVVVVATGSRDGAPTYDVDPGAADAVRSACDHLRGLLDDAGSAATAGADGADGADDAVVVLDPIGGPIGVSVAETCAAAGRRVHLVTQDLIPGNELSRSGDLAPANARLQQAGVRLERRSLPRAVHRSGRGVAVEVEDRFTGERRCIEADEVVDAGFRRPDDHPGADGGNRGLRVGDAVAPRTLHEAILEGRRVALAIDGRP